MAQTGQTKSGSWPYGDDEGLWEAATEEDIARHLKAGADPNVVFNRELYLKVTSD